MSEAGDDTRSRWRAKLHEVIFEAETPSGKAFDVALLAAILLSTTAVMLESVADIRLSHGGLLRDIEWVFTVLFTIEYALRLICVGKPLHYALSFYGIVDLLAIAPTYVSLFFTGTAPLAVIRALRLLRVFRVLKMAHFLREGEHLSAALRASGRKILVFLYAVLTLVLVVGSLMYVIETADENSGFTSIPQSIYWAIVTMTTVGYGDIAPQTVLGKVLASFVMILGYGIIAVPTGIVTVEMSKARPVSTQSCPECSHEGHDPDAKHCKYCGAKL